MSARPSPCAHAALDLSLDRDRVDRLAHVLGGRQLHHADEPEFDVDVDDGAVRGVRERDVRVALAAFVVDRLGRAVVVLVLLVDHLVAEHGRPRRR